MKHQSYIDIFKQKGEWDGCCWVIWFDGVHLGNILLGDYTDILGAFLSPDIHTGGYGISFLVSSSDDKDQLFCSFHEFPYRVQKDIIEYIKSI